MCCTPNHLNTNSTDADIYFQSFYTQTIHNILPLKNTFTPNAWSRRNVLIFGWR